MTHATQSVCGTGITPPIRHAGGFFSRTPTPPVAAAGDFFRIPTGPGAESLAVRGGSKLAKTISGVFRCVTPDLIAQAEKDGLNLNRLALVYSIPEVAKLTEGGSGPFTIYAGKYDGLIKSTSQSLVEVPINCVPVTLELQRLNGRLKLLWADVDLIENEPAKIWFKGREGKYVPLPGDLSDYSLVGTPAEIIEYNFSRLIGLFDMKSVASLSDGGKCHVAVWVDLATGFIEETSQDIGGKSMQGLGLAVSQVTRADRSTLTVQFVDTAGIAGIHREVLDWYQQAFISVVDSRHPSGIYSRPQRVAEGRAGVPDIDEDVTSAAISGGRATFGSDTDATPMFRPPRHGRRLRLI